MVEQLRCGQKNGMSMIMKDLERTIKALANKRRLAILRYLKSGGEASVGNIAAEIRLSFRSTSKHLGVLAAADIVEKDQRSLQIFYKIAPSQKPAAKYIISLL